MIRIEKDKIKGLETITLVEKRVHHFGRVCILIHPVISEEFRTMLEKHLVDLGFIAYEFNREGRWWTHPNAPLAH